MTELRFDPHRSTRLPGLATIVVCAGLLGGCSLAATTLAVDADEALLTGSIAPAAAAPLDAVLDPADQDAAMTALGAALDPQAGGGAVDWVAAGGRRGAVTPVGLARPDGDDICRDFDMRGAGRSGPFRIAGAACRDKRGEWRVRALSAARKA